MTKYEYLYVSFRLIGRGYTGEIVDLHINGTHTNDFSKVPDMLNGFGGQGWELKTYGDKGENGTFEKMVFMRRMD